MRLNKQDSVAIVIALAIGGLLGYSSYLYRNMETRLDQVTQERDEAIGQNGYKDDLTKVCLSQKDTLQNYLNYALQAVDNMSATMDRWDRERDQAGKVKAKKK